MTVPRVFFDTNGGTMQGGYWLTFDQSRKDLEALSDELRNGTRVIIYMPNELEMDAVLRFDATEAIWWADPIAGSIRYLDGSA